MLTGVIVGIIAVAILIAFVRHAAWPLEPQPGAHPESSSPACDPPEHVKERMRQLLRDGSLTPDAEHATSETYCIVSKERSREGEALGGVLYNVKKGSIRRF